MKIVEYTNNENIVVEFQDDHKFRRKSFNPTMSLA